MGDEPARILEIITPGGFETYFERLSAPLADGDVCDPSAHEAIAADHGLEVEVTSIPRLTQEHGLR